MELEVRSMPSSSYSSYSSLINKYYYHNEEGLDVIHEKLTSLYKSHKLEEENRIFKKFNDELVTIIDKSLTRDSKLDELLDGK